jgi:hypothetical protein
VDVDGATLTAQNNWWGQASGPDEDNPSVGIRPQIYYGAPIEDGLAGHWTFDSEWTTNTTAYDRSGLGNNGILQGGLSLANQVAGQHGEALNFDGVNDNINMGDVLDLAQSYTLYGTVNSNDVNSGRIIVKDDGAVGWALSLNDGGLNRLRHFNRQQTGILTDSAPIVTNGAWHQAVGMYSFTTQIRSVYVDAVLSSSTPNAPQATPNNSSSLQIGEGNFFGPFTGMIDDARIYNRALDPSELSELYRQNTSSAVDTAGFLSSAP